VVIKKRKDEVVRMKDFGRGLFFFKILNLHDFLELKKIVLTKGFGKKKKIGWRGLGGLGRFSKGLDMFFCRTNILTFRFCLHKRELSHNYKENKKSKCLYPLCY